MSGDPRALPTNERPVIIAACDVRTGRFYAKQFGLEPGHFRVITRTLKLHGITRASIIVVNSDNGYIDEELIDEVQRLEMMSSAGVLEVEVDWLGEVETEPRGPRGPDRTRRPARDGLFW